MMSCTFIPALLLCILSWILVSAAETKTVEVQPGEDVTLLCSKISSQDTHAFWFKLVNNSEPQCISSIYGSVGDASYCESLKAKSQFETSANLSFVILKIKNVKLSDSALYICGMYDNPHTVIVNVTLLKVQGKDKAANEVEDDLYQGKDKADNGVDNKVDKYQEPFGISSMILGAVIVILIVVIMGLAVKIRRLSAINDQPQPQSNENPDTSDLNYAALSFHQKKKRSRRPQTELGHNVVYAATR